MSYYQFNRKEVLQTAKERYSRKKVAEYYLKNKVKKSIQKLVRKRKR